MTTLPPLQGSDAIAAWQRFLKLLWFDQDLGFWLDISRMGVSEQDLQAMREPFARAHAAMAALEAGAIANADEQRQVGHYWLRNPSLAPDAQTADHKIGRAHV